MKHARTDDAKSRALAELKESAEEMGFGQASGGVSASPSGASGSDASSVAPADATRAGKGAGHAAKGALGTSGGSVSGSISGSAPGSVSGSGASQIKIKKKRHAGLVVVLVFVLAALAVAGAYGASRYLTEQADLRMREQAEQVALGAFDRVDDALESTGNAKARVDAVYASKLAAEQERQAEVESRRDSLIEAARQKAVDEAHAAAIEKAYQEAIDAARAAYDAEVEAERVRRASDFSDTILFGDSIMQNSQGALYAEMPGVTVNAQGGRAIEIGPIGGGSDPNDGVLDHIRADSGGFGRYVIGTGNNDAGGMSLGVGEEIVSIIGPDKEIYFVTEYVGGNPGGTAATNATIAALEERFDNVRAIRWNELVSPDPGAYLSDGCHPLAGAMPTYARLIRETICDFEPEPFDPEKVEFDPDSVPFDESSVEFDPASALPACTDDIMGESIVSAASMVHAFGERGVPYPTEVYEPAGAASIEDFARLCVEEADAEGVRAEVLFAQAMHETGWLQFGNQVSADQNNFGGLGAVNGGGEGESFPDVRTGLRAQAQHLKAYASTEELANEVVDTRFDLVERGVAPKVGDLAGRWAIPGDGYADTIMEVVRQLYEIEYGQAPPA